MDTPKSYTGEEFLLAAQVAESLPMDVWLPNMAALMLTFSVNPEAFLESPEHMMFSLQTMATKMPLSLLVMGTAKVFMAEAAMEAEGQ